MYCRSVWTTIGVCVAADSTVKIINKERLAGVKPPGRSLLRQFIRRRHAGTQILRAGALAPPLVTFMDAWYFVHP